MTYRNKVDGTINLVLQKGEIDPGRPTLVRMHRISIFDDVLGQPGDRKRMLQRAMTAIGKEGSGILVLLRSRDDTELTAEMASGGKSPRLDLRSYGIGAQILAHLGVHDMALLTSRHRNVVALEGYGLRVVDERIFS